MASSLFGNQNQQNQLPSGMGNLKEMMQMYKAASNPQAFIQNMLRNNPNAAQVMQLINSNGGNPKAAFYSLARQRGINPEDFLRALQ